MPDIFHNFPITAPIQKVFERISTPQGLDTWWTSRSSGTPAPGFEYTLWFGPEYDWRAIVSACIRDEKFELKMTQADNDWIDTRVGFILEKEDDNNTAVRFYHTGWPAMNDHYKTSAFCWAMYLRLLKRFLEHKELVAYDDRLFV